MSRIGQLENHFCALRDKLLKAIPLRVQLRQLKSIIGYKV
jgi:hypothetical protein